MTKLEELAKKIYNECKKDKEPVTMAEALEMAEMELKNAENVEKTTANKPKKPRKPRVYVASDEKTQIFADVFEFLSIKYDVSVVTNNKKLQILYNNKSFTLDLVENRKKKGEKTENG